MRTNTLPLSELFHSASDLLNEKQAAQHIHVAPNTLSVWRSTGRYQIPFIKVGRLVRYRLSDLDAWLESRLHASGSTK